MHEEKLCALAQVIPKLDESNKEYDMQHEKGHEYHKRIAINPQSTGLDNDWRLLGSLFIYYFDVWNILLETNWNCFTSGITGLGCSWGKASVQHSTSHQ